MLIMQHSQPQPLLDDLSDWRRLCVPKFPLPISDQAFAI